MILKKILENDSSRGYKKLEKSLSSFNVDLTRYKKMDSDELMEAISRMEGKARELAASLPYKAYMKDPRYGRKKLTIEALKMKLDEVRNLERRQKIIKGMTYYKDVSVGGGVVSGKRSTYLGEERKDIQNWVPFSESLRKLKIMEVMRYGSDDDFSNLYFRMADGRPLECANGFMVEHLIESTDEAMELMEKYCDSVWEGPWPWQVRAPKKFKDIIRENEMRNERIAEMRSRFNDLNDQIMEGEVEQSQVIISGRDIVTKINKMIHDLGRISAEAMTELKDKVRSEFGDELAKGLEKVTNENVGSAVDALSSLKKAIGDQMKKMEDLIGNDPLSNELDAIDDKYDDEGDDDDEEDYPSDDSIDLGDDDDVEDGFSDDEDDLDLAPEREKK